MEQVALTQNAVEINWDDVLDVEGTKRRVGVGGATSQRLLHPTRAVVPATLRAGRELCIEISTLVIRQRCRKSRVIRSGVV